MNKVLIVDDEPHLRELYQMQLQSVGQESVVASNGTEGMKVLSKRDDIGMIWSDYNMPSMNGMEFLKQAKKLYPNIPFIFITGSATEQIIKGSGYTMLRKPLQMNVLKKTIDSVMGKDGAVSLEEKI